MRFGYEVSDTESRALHQNLRGLRFHAKGGMGTISIADDLALSRQVAVKELALELVDNQEARLRFIREAEVTGMLEHPGVVPSMAWEHKPMVVRFMPCDLSRERRWKKRFRILHQTLPRGRKAFRSQAFRKLLRHFVDVCDTDGIRPLQRHFASGLEAGQYYVGTVRRDPCAGLGTGTADW